MPISGRDPLRVPVQFWQRPEVTEALDAPRHRALFRLLRQYCGPVKPASAPRSALRRRTALGTGLIALSPATLTAVLRESAAEAMDFTRQRTTSSVRGRHTRSSGSRDDRPGPVLPLAACATASNC
jgi:hypothetical protein